VGSSVGSIGNGVAKSGIGGSDSTIAESSIAKSSISKSSISKTGISKTVVSIRVSISTIKDSSLGISVSVSITLLAATWD